MRSLKRPPRISETGAPQACPSRSKQANSSAAKYLNMIVVKRGGGVGNAEPEFLQSAGIPTKQSGFECAKGVFARLAPAAHFPEADQPVVRLDLHHGANKAPPVTSIGMTQRRCQRNTYGRGAEVFDFHTVFYHPEDFCRRGSVHVRGAFSLVMHDVVVGLPARPFAVLRLRFSLGDLLQGLKRMLRFCASLRGLSLLGPLDRQR